MLTIRKRPVNDVVILYLDGRIVLGEESILLRDRIQALIEAGNKKIVMHLRNIEFIDSAGLGTLVAGHHSAKSQGCALKIVNLGDGFKEVLQITKLLTVFDVYQTIRDAVASFGTQPIHCLCPICGGICKPPQIKQSNWKLQECITCGAAFDVNSPELTATAPVVRSIKMTSYLSDNDYVEIRILSERVVKIGIAGRLDLFSFTPLKKAWHVIARPRRMIISLVETTEISAGGLDALFSFKAATGTDDQVLVSLRGLKQEHLGMFPQEFRTEMKTKLATTDLEPKSGGDFWELKTLA